MMRARWGLGPRIDPHFDAKIGRAVMGRGPGPGIDTGYIELSGPSPYDNLVALFETLYDHSLFGSSKFVRFTKKLKIHDRPNVWTQIDSLRYLTTDAATGVALPLHDFNPTTDDPGWPGNRGAKLQQAIDRLNSITENRLQSASMIGLTVSFKYGVLGRKLKSILKPSLMRRVIGVSERQARAQIEQILFGGVNPSWGAIGRFMGPRVGARQFDAQDVAGSSGFSPQLDRAMRELHTGCPQPPPSSGDLTYGLVETGRNVIVGLVDFGCDFAHPSFCSDALGTESRVLALWDQNCKQDGEPTQQPIVSPGTACAVIGTEKCGFGYGRLFTKDQIDLVLKTWRETSAQDNQAPYRMLGYDPHHNHYTSKPPGSDGGPPGAHGTMVLDIAAGGRRQADSAGGADAPIVRGVASEARIVFVQVRLHKQQDGRRILDANDVIDGVAFIFHVANQLSLPCVVNLSLNTMSGPHDGDGHFERRLSSLLKSHGAGPQIKGRAIVIAAGNLPGGEVAAQQWQHLADSVSPVTPFEFYWLPPNSPDTTRNSVEIWYDPDQAWLRASLVSPAGEAFGPISPGQAAELIVGTDVRGSIVGSRLRPAMRDNDPLKGQSLPKDDNAAGRHVILFELDSQLAMGGCWKVRLEVVDKTHAPLHPDAPPVSFHAWLERDDDGQSGICRTNPATSIPLQDQDSTIGTLSCGEDAIVVGAYDTLSSVAARSGLSGRGPRRNAGVAKPDIAAPGNYISLIRSKRGYETTKRIGFGGGTSMAAPFVSGTIACMYQVAPCARLSTIRNALTSTTREGLDNPNEPWSPEFGYGRLNPAAALTWVKNNLEPDDECS